jgi:hypothetical protein
MMNWYHGVAHFDKLFICCLIYCLGEKCMLLRCIGYIVVRRVFLAATPRNGGRRGT